MMLYGWDRETMEWQYNLQELEYYVVVGLKWRKVLSPLSLA